MHHDPNPYNEDCLRGLAMNLIFFNTLNLVLGIHQENHKLLMSFIWSYHCLEP